MSINTAFLLDIGVTLRCGLCEVVRPGDEVCSPSLQHHQPAPVAVVLADKWEEVQPVIRKHPAVKQPAGGHTSCSVRKSLLGLKAALVPTQRDTERRDGLNVIITRTKTC